MTRHDPDGDAGMPRRGLMRRFLDLPPHDRRIFLRAWRLLLKYRLWLAISSRERIARYVARAMASPADPAAADDRAGHWLALANRAARHHVIRSNCLVRGLAGRELLSGLGVGSRLKIGVARGDRAGLNAHAWLESGGRVVGDSPDIASRFVVFDDPRRLPGDPRRWR